MSAVGMGCAGSSSMMQVDHHEGKRSIKWVIVVVPKGGSAAADSTRCYADRVIQKLQTILAENAYWGDPLSKELFKWGAHVILAFNELRKSAESLPADADVRLTHLASFAINKLYKRVLHNPMVPEAFLEVPVIEGAVFEEVDAKGQKGGKRLKLTFCRVWESRVLAHYQTLADRSPYDHKMFGRTDSHAHLFAKSILEWVNHYKLNCLLEPCKVAPAFGELMTKVSEDKDFVAIQLRDYILCAKLAIANAELSQLKKREGTSGTQKALEANMEAIQQKCAQFAEAEERVQHPSGNLGALLKTQESIFRMALNKLEDKGGGASSSSAAQKGSAVEVQIKQLENYVNSEGGCGIM